jgi:hypothetical protein
MAGLLTNLVPQGTSRIDFIRQSGGHTGARLHNHFCWHRHQSRAGIYHCATRGGDVVHGGQPGCSCWTNLEAGAR